jgi:signal transduction histidine kinase
VLVLYNSRILAANVEVGLEVDAPDANVLARPGELRQVIANIVGNAIDAMRHGGRLRLRISEEQGNGESPRVRLTIADTGSGIPSSLLPSIFEPFVTTKGETGTGLGLWVTGEIIRRNDWDIRVRSRCGPRDSGTVFSITMRLHSATALIEPASAVA